MKNKLNHKEYNIKNEVKNKLNKLSNKTKTRTNKIIDDLELSEKKLYSFLKERNISIKDIEQILYYNKLKETNTFSIND
jgi:phage antirepressor YoqD-like protein